MSVSMRKKKKEQDYKHQKPDFHYSESVKHCLLKHGALINVVFYHILCA